MAASSRASREKGLRTGAVESTRLYEEFRAMCHHRSNRRREGFTLIELLMVLLIIAILIGILVPVISGAFNRANEAKEVNEIHSFVSDLQQFKDRFGVYPPSQIILREDGAYTAGGAPFIGPSNPPPPQLSQDTAVFDENISIQYIRRIWPQMVIHTDGSAVTPAEIGDINGDGVVNAGDFYDWNGDGILNGPWFLQGDECLVFFLGGIPTGDYPIGLRQNSGPAGGTGFGKNGRWPTQRAIAGTSSVSRDGPFHEFESRRLCDRDGDSFYEYIPSRKPGNIGGYAYFSAYDGAGYRPDDLNFAIEPTGTSSISTVVGFLEFRVSWSWQLSGYPALFQGTTSTSVRSPGPNPYTLGIPFSPAVPSPRYVKSDSFQIISPGPDNSYGQGGAAPRLGYPSPPPPPPPYYDETPEDADNLANFATGKIKDMEQQ